MTPTSEVVASARYRVGNPSAWAEGYDEVISEEIRALLALISSLVAERDRLREALTPSGDTKAAYIGEFSFGVTLRAGNQEDYRRIEVPWTTIKEIMSAISERASIGGGNG